MVGKQRERDREQDDRKKERERVYYLCIPQLTGSNLFPVSHLTGTHGKRRQRPPETWIRPREGKRRHLGQDTDRQQSKSPRTIHQARGSRDTPERLPESPILAKGKVLPKARQRLRPTAAGDRPPDETTMCPKPGLTSCLARENFPVGNHK